MKRKSSSLVKVIFLLFVTVFIAGYLGKHFWVFDLCSHFRLQYMFVGLAFSMILLLQRSFRFALISAIIALICVFEVYTILPTQQSTSSNHKSFKLITINLLSSNDSYSKALGFINAENPDILVLQEFTTAWSNYLAPHLNDYPHQYLIPQEDNFGLAIFSKFSMNQTQRLDLNANRLPSIITDIEVKGKSVTLLATHPLPPMGSSRFESRNLQFEKIITEHSANSQRNFILTGDLNCSPYSYHFKHLTSSLKLKDTRTGFSVHGTWPTYLPFMRIPLDHCLISQNIETIDRYNGPDIGSDHLPIVCVLAIE